MGKDRFTVKIKEEVDKEFRLKVKEQGKQFNLAMEEAMRLWTEKEKNKKNKK